MPNRKQAHTSEKTYRIAVSLICLLALFFATYSILEETSASKSSEVRKPAGRNIQNDAELQIALARAGFSPGSIDGLAGKQSKQALLAYQKSNGLERTGALDEATQAILKITEPTHAQIELSATTLSSIEPKPNSWVERGQRSRMSFHSILELVAEKTQADPDYILALNPNINWNTLKPGDRILAPLVSPFRIDGPINHLHVNLADRVLSAWNSSGQILFHCPVSIARNADKRPSGELEVVVRVADPNYTFNPAILSVTAAREGITEKFIIQPGPNNPVGTVWIGLNLPSYGIHGTPEPEKVGRTESSGCFRLANWNAEILLNAVEMGTRVIVGP